MARESINPRSPDAAAERLFELSEDMLGTASLEGYFTRLNPAWQRTLGWTNDQLMAQPYVSFVHPDDVEATTSRTATLATQDKPQPQVGFENRYRTVNGDYRWVHWSTTVDDDVIYFVAKDVTESKTVEMNLAQTAGVMQAIVESVADGLYVADANGEFTFMNPAALKLLGYDAETDVLGRHPHATIHHSYPDGSPYPQEDCPLTKVRLTGEPAYSDDDTFWCHDGSALPVAFSSAPIDLAEGRGSVVAFRDITERKVREASQQQEIEDALWLAMHQQSVLVERVADAAQP